METLSITSIFSRDIIRAKFKLLNFEEAYDRSPVTKHAFDYYQKSTLERKKKIIAGEERDQQYFVVEGIFLYSLLTDDGLRTLKMLDPISILSNSLFIAYICINNEIYRMSEKLYTREQAIKICKRNIDVMFYQP